ncbi:MAG TPA: hypothetical protein VK817_24405 [Trebonia sp.]|nr:hypothetical protein [Trebonia sp.]
MPRTTPGRLRASVAVVAALGVVLAVVIAMASAGITGDFQSIGQRDAPEVTAATGLYFSLNDMDAQVANVLLVGNDTALAADRAQDMSIYSSDRATADADLQQAAVTASGNSAAQRELRTVLNDVGQYEALAADSMLTDQQAGPAADRPGRTPATPLGYYRQATDLMRTGILPTVSSLTSVNSDGLDAAYQAGGGTASTGTGLIIGAGILLLAALVAFQLYLTRRFRRIINPALAAATVLTLAVTIAAAAHLGDEKTHLTVAKVDAFNSVLALSQAQAVSYDANADESRYLVDPQRAGQYQQAFLTESRQLADVGNVGIFGYDAALAADISAYDKNNADVRFGGYLGTEFRNITFTGERAAAVRTLLAYQVYERDDRKLRALAKTNLAAAVAFDIGTGPAQSDAAFNRYSAALSSVIAINQNAFAAAVAAGEGGGLWNGALPAAAAALIAALALLGVRPRLAEYRLVSSRHRSPKAVPAGPDHTDGPGHAGDTVFDLPVAPLRSGPAG